MRADQEEDRGSAVRSGWVKKPLFGCRVNAAAPMPLGAPVLNHALVTEGEEEGDEGGGGGRGRGRAEGTRLSISPQSPRVPPSLRT